MAEKLVEISVENAVKEIKNTVGRLGSYETSLAITRALNRAADMTKVEASKQIRTKYNRKASGVKADIHVIKATQNNQTAYIKPSSLRKKINMSSAKGATDYKARQGAEGVYLRIKKGKKTLIKNAFIQHMKSGHVGVFARGAYNSDTLKDFTRMSERYPITELTTLSTFKMLDNPEMLEAVNHVAQTAFVKRFEHEVDRILSKKSVSL